MNYDTAKKLKNAKFPFKDGKVYQTVFTLSSLMDDIPHYAYVPTLEELIEAVIGNKPNTFSVDFNEEWSLYEPMNEDGPWSARYYNLTPVGFYEVGAKTPSEAVAKLWLELNSKEK